LAQVRTGPIPKLHIHHCSFACLALMATRDQQPKLDIVSLAAELDPRIGVVSLVVDLEKQPSRCEEARRGRNNVRGTARAWHHAAAMRLTKQLEAESTKRVMSKWARSRWEKYNRLCSQTG